MKVMKKIIFFLLIISIKSDATIDFSSLSSGTGYTVNGNTVTISEDGTYTLTGTNTDKSILVSSSATLVLNSLSLTSTGSLTPIIIDSSKSVTMTLSGTSTLTDSSSNENEGVIYLNSGASLTISGDGTLNLTPNKNMAINGTSSTSLTVNGGNIQVTSSSSGVGGIYLRKEITFNDCTYSYSATSGSNHAIDSEGNINIVKGTYTLNSGSGKGIQTEKYLYLGKTGSDNSDLSININCSNEGIEAERIIIYSGKLTIDASEDGINAAGDDCEDEGQCRGNCNCYITISGGKIEINSGEDGLDSNGDITISGGKTIVYGASTGADQPIDQDGTFSITGGSVFAAGSNEMGGGVQASTSLNTVTYTNTIASGKQITITDSSNNEVFSITNKKEVKYLYFASSSTGLKINIGDSSGSTTQTSTTATSTTQTSTTAATTTRTTTTTATDTIQTSSNSTSDRFILITPNKSVNIKQSYLYLLFLLILL